MEKFSDYIRLGIPLIPARREGLLFYYGDDGEPCAACALGTGMIAAGMKFRSHSQILRRWPILSKRVQCPVPMCDDFFSLWLVASELFETHGWSREQVADFIEPHEEAAILVPQEAERALR